MPEPENEAHRGPQEPRSFIHYFAEPLPHGRAIMRVDTVINGKLVESHTTGSPAPMTTVKAHERIIRLGGES